MGTDRKWRKETKVSALLNGNMHMGMVVVKNAMERALKKAKRTILKI